MTEPILAPELRLALAMRGGVSLSVWIGGVVREIDRFRRDVVLGGSGLGEGESALGAVARAAGYERVEVDVVSGASAGGLNAVILGAAVTNGKSLDMLRDVWLDAAAIEYLVRKPTREPQNSILRGDYFLRALEANLTALMSSASGDPRLVTGRLDVLLSVTSVVSNELSASLDPRAPVSEPRIDGQIHLRRRGSLLNEFAADRTHDLACAARSTAAFPVAFEPLRIPPEQLLGDVDFRPARPEPLLLFDGGVTDNMPVGKAARAIQSAPADGPTDRLLLYLHPSPGVPDTAAAHREIEARRALARWGARPFDVLRTAIRSLRSKSLVEDLQAIEAHNDDVERQLTDRDRLLEPVRGPAPDDPSPSTVVAPELDAARLVDLFASPWVHVAEHIPPREFAPRAGNRNGDALQQLVRRLAAELTTVHLPSAEALPVLSRHSLRPWGALIRISSLLIEWCRCGDDDADVTDAVGALKGRLYDLRDVAVRTAAALNVATLDACTELSSDDNVAARDLVRVRAPIVVGQLPQVRAQWDELASIACVLSSYVPRVSSPTDGPSMLTGSRPGGELRLALERLLPSGVTPEPAKRALDCIDVALLPLHRTEPRGSLDHIRYLTISGNAGTPLARSFEWPQPVPVPEPRFATIRPLPEPRVAGADLAFDHTRSDASSKLAGNQLHNFSAFLERSWRANDWMWGQIDGAATIVDLVLDPARLSRMSPARRDQLAEAVHGICTAPVRVDGAEHPWSPSVVDAAQRSWTGDVHEAVRAELAAVHARDPVPPITRTLLLWRRQVEIALVELDRDPADSPTGGTRPDGLAHAVQQWDGTSRSLGDKWGERRVTALGMRTVFVGWRALFTRVTSVPLRAARTLLGPIVAPLVMFTLCRRRTSFAFAVFLFGFVVPRVWSSGVGQVLVGILAFVFALGWLLLTRDTWVDDQGRRHRRFDLFTEVWGLATVVATLAVFAELVVIDQSWLRDVRPETPLRGGLWPYLLPVGSVVVVTFVTWYWAKVRWRVLITVLNGAITASWVWLAAKTVTDPHDPWPSLQLVGSFWWALIVMILVTTLLGYNVDFADLPEQPDE